MIAPAPESESTPPPASADGGGLADAPVIVILTASGLQTGAKLASSLPGSSLHGFAPRVEARSVDATFVDMGGHIRACFASGRSVIGLCATGILIRCLAPSLSEKREEPPVIAIAEDGGAIVPLLGVHHGGAALARRCGEILGVEPVSATLGERRGGFVPEMPPCGWSLGDSSDVKGFAASLGEDARVVFHGEDEGEGARGEIPAWLAKTGLSFVDEASASASTPTIGVSIRRDAASRAKGPHLLYHPRRLALGAGCERDIDSEDFAAQVDAFFRRTPYAPAALSLIATVDLKYGEAALHDLADRYGVPLRVFPPAALAAEAGRLTSPSPLVEKIVGSPSVAEAAALAAVGARGRLLVPKATMGRATLALAAAPDPLDPRGVGAPVGSLSIVGLGPGSSLRRTMEATEAILRADAIVGFSSYVESLGGLTRGKRVFSYPIGAERERVIEACRLAGGGVRTALACSGDPGVYAMAALVFEILDHPPPVLAGGPRLDVRVIPGVSAMQMAAARFGAPLGHDFCAVSLSDLLTDEATIKRRLEAAAAADFAVALYNPASRRRRSLLPEAWRIFAAHRPPQTPVGLARRLDRDGERTVVTTLEACLRGGLTAAGMEIDMETVILIGTTTTRRCDIRALTSARRFYTPRGYALKARSCEEGEESG